MRMRVQRFLSQAGVCSRRRGEQLISEGKIRVNGQVLTNPAQQIDPEVDSVEFDSKLLSGQQPHIYLFNKPLHVLTTLSDPHGRRTIADYLNQIPVRVFPVGRLDYDVSGLLVLTNDGGYAQKMLHPRYEVKRIYHAVVNGVLDQATAERLCQGVTIGKMIGYAESVRGLHSSAYLQNASIQGVDAEDRKSLRREPYKKGSRRDIIEIVVAEGRKHFVKNILAVVGLPVIRLCRVGFGPYRLGSIPQGSLTKVEFKSL